MAMKILVYTDVHGNNYALEKLFKTKDYQTADKRIFLGDAVYGFLNPNLCVEKICQSGDVFLLGNHDSYVAFGLSDFDKVERLKKFYINYERRLVTKQNRKILAALPKDFHLCVEGKKFYFTHFPWRTKRIIHDDVSAPQPTSKSVASLFGNVDADYIFFGHNHTPGQFESGGKIYYCVGSFGDLGKNYYMVINVENGKVQIKRKKVEYDENAYQKDFQTTSEKFLSLARKKDLL